MLLPRAIFDSFIHYSLTPHDERISYEEWAILSRGNIPVEKWNAVFKNKSHTDRVFRQLMADRTTEPTQLMDPKKKWGLRERLKYSFLQEKYKDLDPPIGA